MNINEFSPVFVRGTTLGDVWFNLLVHLNQYGRKYLITSGSHEGEHRVEFDMASGWIDFPHSRPLAPILPPSVIAVPTNDDKIEKYFQEYLMDPNKRPDEEYRYSEWINGKIFNRWTQSFTTALEWTIDHFRKKGYGNNHCYITVGSNETNFRYDKPYDKDKETERGTSPCLRGIDIKVKENHLLLGIIYRSWDLYSGWPENMGGFTLLGEYITEMICSDRDDLFAGPMGFFSMGLHCYDHQLNAVMQVLGKG